MLKIEIIYKDSRGNILTKEDIQKSKIRTNHVNPNLVDANGFQYKTRKSKNSMVKFSKTEPQQIKEKFSSEESDELVKIQNEKFFLLYNKVKNHGELYQKIDPTLVKNFLKDQKRMIKEIKIEIEKINEAKNNEESFLNLVEKV